MNIRTTLVSAQRLSLELLQLLVDGNRDFVLAGAVALADDTAIDLPPADLVLLAAYKADAQALSLVARIAEADRGHLLFIGDLATSYDVACLRAAGVRGVVCWSQPSSDLFAAARRVAGGFVSVPLQLAPLGVADRDPVGFAHHPLACLTPREREVFAHVVAGCSNSVVARRLGISAKTADTHRAHVMRKLCVHSAVDLVRFAARHDLLDDQRLMVV